MTQVTETLTLRLEAGEINIDDLTAMTINREFFNGDMTTYEEALEVYQTLCDEYLYFWFLKGVIVTHL